MATHWTVQRISDIVRSFQPACVITAAADLNVFSPLHEKPMTAESLADAINTDPRATTVLLDALAALELLSKKDNLYSVPKDAAKLLTEQSSDNILPMIRHLSNCLRRWSRLAWVTQSGRPAEREPSVRGRDGDIESFIGAMNNISSVFAAEVIDKLKPLKFKHLLDIGGASGTWTIEFLRAAPKASATLFDQPDVIPLAEKRVTEADMSDRIKLVAGDFYIDKLPAGADLAFLGAICHQNSREQNRALFEKVYEALKSGGCAVIRDVVMEPSRTSPQGGALFAVNMLVSTEKGKTYTFDEYKEDLTNAGFTEVQLIHHDQHMNSLIRAAKPKNA